MKAITAIIIATPAKESTIHKFKDKSRYFETELSSVNDEESYPVHLHVVGGDGSGPHIFAYSPSQNQVGINGNGGSAKENLRLLASTEKGFSTQSGVLNVGKDLIKTFIDSDGALNEVTVIIENSGNPNGIGVYGELIAYPAPSGNFIRQKVQKIYDAHKITLQNLKNNRAELVNPTDAEVRLYDSQITLLASVLGDLYREILHEEK